MRLVDEAEAAPLAPATAEARPLRIVAAGGGTGLPRVLAGLATGVEPEENRRVAVTALVTAADDGGSSGELRRAFGLPAPGDARNCLVALSAGLNPLASLFQHRFEGEGGLGGHTVGNVVLAALAQRLGDFGLAVEAAGRLLEARGRVLPSATEPVELVAALEDGREVRGESALAAARGRVRSLRLSRAVSASPEAIAAILEADLVVLGPGSLYSSVVASLLPAGLASALRATAATRVLVVNLFTQPGETDGLSAQDHLAAVQRHLGDVVDVALAHRPPLSQEVVARFAARGQRPVELDRGEIEALGAVPVLADLVAPGDVGRHDPQKLARALVAIARVR